MSKLNEYGIVYVDDETMALKYFEKGFSQDFKVFTAPSAAEGWELVQKHHDEVGILMTDQRMPGATGVELLEKVRNAYPRIIRILVTAYSDVESAVAGVNNGAIYRYISKPWDVADLKINLLRALEYFGVLKERDHLLREKLSVLQQVVMSDRSKNLSVLAAGLASHYRNTLEAAEHFIRSLPKDAPVSSGFEPGHSVVAKAFENSMKESSDHIAQIASTMARLAKDEASNAGAPVPLGSILSSVEKSPSRLRGGLSVQISPSLPSVAGNPEQISALFTALVSALDNLAEQPVSITIQASGPEDYRGRKTVKVIVADSGSEWSSSQQARLFAPFTNGDRQSSLGIGLAACFFLIHHLGGTIEVTGSPSARFVVFLPIEPPVGSVQAVSSDRLANLFSYERGWEQFLKA